MFLIEFELRYPGSDLNKHTKHLYVAYKVKSTHKNVANFMLRFKLLKSKFIKYNILWGKKVNLQVLNYLFN